MLLTPLLFTTLAGLSTALGGVVAALFRPTPRLLAVCSGFAGGVMLTISLADLAPSAVDFYRGYFSALGSGLAVAALMLAGMLVAALLARALPDEAELAVALGAAGPDRAAALRTAVVTWTALLLHNLPEGVLTLFAGVADPSLGLRTAVAIALHNIPEGLAVAAPFAYATRSRGKGVVAALASGLAEPAGALLAYGFLRAWLTPGLLTGTVALVAGIMLWVAADQLLPVACAPGSGRAGCAGVAAGCLVMLAGIAALP